MYEPNVDTLLQLLRPTDVVLDVGGWACPFNRANWILDSEPYDTRGFYRTFGGKPFQGGDREWFTRDTWIQRDICDHMPWPFADKQFDFVVCSHTLEDIRDPLWVCSELARVGRRGYIEVPSREWETCRGIERPRMAGLSHHRWLIEIHGNEIGFLPKYHMINAHWRFSLPASHGRGIPGGRAVQSLWWEGNFRVQEIVINGLSAQESELERFVQSVRPYPNWRVHASRGLDRASGLAARVGGAIVRRTLGALGCAPEPR